MPEDERLGIGPEQLDISGVGLIFHVRGVSSWGSGPATRVS
jgi:hypothetical protein